MNPVILIMKTISVPRCRCQLQPKERKRNGMWHWRHWKLSRKSLGTQSSEITCLSKVVQSLMRVVSTVRVLSANKSNGCLWCSGKLCCCDCCTWHCNSLCDLLQPFDPSTIIMRFVVAGMMMSKGGLCRGLEWVMDLDDTRDGPLTLAPTQGEVAGWLVGNWLISLQSTEVAVSAMNWLCLYALFLKQYGSCSTSLCMCWGLVFGHDFSLTFGWRDCQFPNNLWQRILQLIYAVFSHAQNVMMVREWAFLLCLAHFFTREFHNPMLVHR